MSFLSSSKTVLILGDEGLQIFAVTSLGARFVEFITWNTDDFEQTVQHILTKNCKKKPVVLLNDMVEQHYRKERVPKVGLMDRANVLKRRLGIAFPNYKIRAALKLDERLANMAQPGKGQAYLFAAIPASDAFQKTMSAVQSANVTVVGLYLLPIEAAAMVKALSVKAFKEFRGRASWTIFMGQHEGGGVRQIVTRNGELALTRMSPIVDTDVEPELWAKEISGELNATMSYLTRFGYKETDGLNVLIVGNDVVDQYVENAISVNCNLKVLNAEQAAKFMNVNLGMQKDLRYADPLHAAYLGRKGKFRLPMQTTVVDSITKPKRIANFVILGLLAGAAYFGYQAFTAWTKSLEVNDSMRMTEERMKSVKQEYDVELEKKKAIGFDFLLVKNSVETFNEIRAEKIKPLPLIKAIGNSIGADLNLDEFVLKRPVENVVQQKILNRGKKNRNNEDDNVKKLNKIEGIMTLSFDEDVDSDLGVELINDFRDRLQNNLQNYDVKVVKQVADLSYTGNFVGESGRSSAQNDEPEDYTAEIMITGPLK